MEERLQEIEECTDKEKKQQLIDELDEEKRQVRKKSLGNIKLIGALYKNGRLKDEIMDLCIETLIKNGDEDSLECLCSLLKSIGQKFEGKTQHKNRFNEQMKRLERLVSQNKVVSRIKFLIMDVLDMRKDNWTLRKLQNVNKPKTIEEVHEDAKKKEEESNREISQLKNRPDSLKKRTDNSWMNSNSRKSQQSNSDALTNLRKLNEQRDNPPSLGPQSFGFGPKNYGSWSQGASAAKPAATSSNDRKTINQAPPRNENRLDNSRSSSRKNLFQGNSKSLSEAKLFELHWQSLKNYLDKSNFDELISSIYNNCTEDNTYLFVITAIEGACESLLKKITIIGDMLVDLVIVQKIITYEQFYKGLKHHLDSSLDVIPDVPKFYEYIGEILTPFFFKLSDGERRTFLKEALSPCLVFDTSIKIAAHLLQNAINKQGLNEVAKKWSSGKMCFEDFSQKQKEDELRELLRSDYKLDEFLKELSNSNCLNEKSVDLSKICDRILSDRAFQEVPKLLKENLSSSDKETNKKLISALFERIFKDTIDDGSEQIAFEMEKFESKFKTLPSLGLRNDIELQLEVIYAAVRVNHQLGNPKDILLNVLSFLNDLKIVEGTAILRWGNEKKSDVPGNTIAIITVQRFIQKFKEAVE